jgi:hypothetical protein
MNEVNKFDQTKTSHLPDVKAVVDVCVLLLVGSTLRQYPKEGIAEPPNIHQRWKKKERSFLKLQNELGLVS